MFTTSIPEAEQELATILETYTGPLPTSLALDFHPSRKVPPPEPLTSNNWVKLGTLDVVFPPQLVKELGVSGWHVAARQLLRLLAREGRRADDWAYVADYCCEDAETGFSVECEDKAKCRRAAALAELWQLLLALNARLKFPHAWEYVKWLRHVAWDATSGKEYQDNIPIVLPADVFNEPVMSLSVGRAMTMIANEERAKGNDEAADKLDYIVHKYYWYDFEGDSRSINLNLCFEYTGYIEVVEYLNHEDLLHINSKFHFEEFAGSVRFHPWTERNAYSIFGGDFEYRIKRFWEFADGGLVEYCVLDNGVHAYLASIEWEEDDRQALEDDNELMAA